MLKPINGNVIIEEFVEEKTSISGNFIMSTEEESKFTKGKVLASDHETINEGDVVIFAKYSPDKIGKLFVIHNSDIFAIEEN